MSEARRGERPSGTCAAGYARRARGAVSGIYDCAGTYELACDDATDCGAGLVCCYVSDGGSRVKASYCKASCVGIERQLCKAGSTECRTGGCTPFVAHAPEGLAECQ